MALALLICATPSAGQERPLYGVCFRAAGQHYSLAPNLLIAIAYTESQLNPLALNTANRNGSWDIGLMQINSRWLPALKQCGITAEQLYDACTNIWAGAWVLAHTVGQYGYTWRAIGAYNAGTATTAAAEQRREAYARRVHRHLRGVAVGLR